LLNDVERRRLRRAKEQENAKLEREKREMDECTFKPKIK
jgi:hypothetical protein